MILVGEIGADKCHLALYESGQDFSSPKYKLSEIRSEKYGSLGALINNFLKQAKVEESVFTACFGMAGFVDEEQRCQLSNSNWSLITADDLQSQLLSKAAVTLLNDVKAIGVGISRLTENDITDINFENPSPKEGSRALIYAPGPGLGAGNLYSDYGDYRPLPSELGHAGFASTSEEVDELVKFLRKKYSCSRVTIEQVVSWSGLTGVYQFIKNSRRAKESSDIKRQLSNKDDEGAARIIIEAALANQDVLCEKALKLFLSNFGAVVGDIAIYLLTENGVYISGELASATLAQKPEYDAVFMEGFTAKEEKGGDQKWCEHNANIPINIIKRRDMVLLGAYTQAQPIIQ